MEARTVEIELQGRRFKIRTAESQELIDRLVEYANSKIEEIAAAGNLSPLDTALLALLAVVEELAKERENLGALKERIRMKSALILDMLEGGGSVGKGDDPSGEGDGYMVTNGE